MDKPEMYLHRRNGIYYFRRRVPSDLEGVIPHFNYSLQTRNRQEAVRAYPAAFADSEEQIAKAYEKLRTNAEKGRVQFFPLREEYERLKAQQRQRKRTRAFCQYGEADILNLVSQWFAKERRETEDHYRKSFNLNSPGVRLKTLKELTEEGRCLEGLRPTMDEFLVSKAVRSILDAEDCAAPREWLNNPLFCRFYGLVSEGLIYLNRIAVSLVEKGEMPERFQELKAFAPAGAQAMPFAPVAGAMPSITLDELINRFQNEPKRKSLREASREEYHFTYRLLREHFGGDKPIASITRDDIRAVTDTIRHLPARATLVDKTTPLQELAARAIAKGQPPINVKTYNKKARHVSVIFRYAMVEQLIASNPAQNLGEAEPPSNGEEKAYNTEQLNAIFTGSIYEDFTENGKALQFVPNHRWQPCLFWAPLIALFHGMRSNEILQLKATNIFQKDGVWAMKIEGELKNFQSYRTLPIHPEVLRIGLVEYADRVKKAGYTDLFPDAKTASDGKRSTWFQKPFSRYLKKIGVKTDRRQCFHSFRHTWNTGMRRADVPDEIRKVLGGWSNESAESGYGSQDMSRLLKYLEKLCYPSLNLSHLHPKA